MPYLGKAKAKKKPGERRAKSMWTVILKQNKKDRVLYDPPRQKQRCSGGAPVV
jgi:hypothetical protein